MGALGALEGRLELADEEVHQLGVVTPDVTLPRLHGLLAHAGEGGGEEGRDGDKVKAGVNIKDNDKGKYLEDKQG